MAVSFAMSSLVYGMFGYNTHPSMEQVNSMSKSRFIMRLFPLAVAFAVSVVLSNEAYRFCSVPFLQMCKELNVVFVYVASVLFALERMSARTCCILAVVIFGCTISIHGQVDFNGRGFTLQITSQMAEICKMLLQAFIMQNMKIDPLTMVMWMAPLCLCAVSSAIFYMWEPAILVVAKQCWHHLLLNSLIAFCLNHSVAYLLRISSGLTMVLAGIVKDICIVSLAAVIFSTHLERIQIVGFFIAIVGIFAHSMVKSFPEEVNEHGVLKGIIVVTVNQFKSPKAGVD
jgi:solute carrier family 35 protein C2